MSFENNIDDALSMVGYGRWQIPMFALSILCYFVDPVHLVGAPLLSVPLSFRCFSSPTASLEATGNYSTTNEPLTGTYDSRCEATEQNVSLPPPLLHETGLPSCPFVEYDHSIFPSTVISEFNLVCERSSLRSLFQMFISIGLLFGAPLGGIISDKYGRKTAGIAGSVVSAAFAVVIAVCPWFSGVLLGRFVLGVTIASLLPSTNLAQETTPPRFRSQTGMLAGLGFSLGIIVLAGVAFLVRPWRHLLLTGSSPFLILIPLACVVEESPRWLAYKGRHKEAAAVLERAARRNRVSITPKLAAVLEKVKAGNKNSDAVEKDDETAPLSGLRQWIRQYWNYLHYPGLRIILLVMPAIWYLQALIYLGIMLNANNFTSNDPFIYVGMSGVMDLIAIILTTPLSMRFGRRPLSGLLLFSTGTLLLLDTAIPEELKWLKWVVVMASILMSAAAYQVLFIYTPELFPTVIRSRSFGFLNGVGSLGLLTAPLITDLLVQKVWWAVNVVCGLAGLLASLLMIFLPETRNLPLPETFQDVEKRRLGSKRGKDSEMEEELAALEADSLHNTEQLLNMESKNSNLEMKESSI